MSAAVSATCGSEEPAAMSLSASRDHVTIPWTDNLVKTVSPCASSPDVMSRLIKCLINIPSLTRNRSIHEQLPVYFCSSTHDVMTLEVHMTTCNLWHPASYSLYHIQLHVHIYNKQMPFQKLTFGKTLLGT